MSALVEATARILVEGGWGALSTNRIARRAGVSIGSLYQYFPNKEALALALFERHLAEMAESRPAALRSVPGAVPLAVRIRAAVDWLLESHARDPLLHRELTALAPRVLGEERLRRFERAYHDALRTILEAYAEELGARDLDLAAFVLGTCLESLTHAAVVHHPERLKHPALADEITTLLLRYLERAPIGGASGPS